MAESFSHIEDMDESKSESSEYFYHNIEENNYTYEENTSMFPIAIAFLYIMGIYIID